MCDTEQMPRALLSVYDKTGIIEFARALHDLGWELLFSGGKARYRFANDSSWWSAAEQLGGKEMSYLNVLDTEAAWNLVWSFDESCAVVIKHANPCGLAVAETIEEAYRRAHACDPLSAFGGIVAINRPCSTAMAHDLGEVFTEVLAQNGIRVIVQPGGSLRDDDTIACLSNP